MQGRNEPAVRLFGSFSYEPGGVALAGPGRRLLARLILGEARPFTRGELAEMLWPEAEGERGRFYLRRALSQIRPVLDERFRLDVNREEIRLFAEPEEVDVLRFDRLVRDDDEALGRAIELHRGPLLAEWPDVWLIPGRESRRLAWHSAIERLAETDLRRDRPIDAVRRLEQAVAADPLREASQRLLIEALRRAGDPAQAERQFARFERQIRRDVGLSPSPETWRALRDDAGQTVRAVPVSPTQRFVPVVTTGLIGREAEFRATLEALKGSRLVTLVGPGGIGKTRLSLACTEEFDAEGFDLIAAIDLASREDGQALGNLVARSVRAPLVPGIDPLESALRHLEDRRALLLLDNCEHLVQAASELAQTILDGCPGVSILATSRQALNLPDETILDVPPLDWAASEQLFRDAAERKGRPISEAAGGLEAVRQICSAVDHLPLGIVLAAAQLRTTTLQALADDLYGALGGEWGGRPRHRSLRTAIEWSYRLLTAEEAKLLRSVSPIQGTWTTEFAEAAAGIGSISDPLRGLVAKSLIGMEEDEVGPSYRLLEPIREDAYRRLVEEGEEPEVRQRLREAVLARSAAIFAQFGGHPQRSEQLRAERVVDVFESVLQDCIKTREGRVTGVRIIADGLTLFDLTNRYREAAALQERFLAEGAEVEPALRAKALAQIVHFRCNWGAATEVIEIAQEAVDLAREADDPLAHAYAVSSQGMAWYYTEQNTPALRAFEEAVSLWGQTEQVAGPFAASIWAGKAASALGDIETAERYFDLATNYASGLDGGHSLALIALNRARLRYRTGEIEQALKQFQNAEASFLGFGDAEHGSSARIGKAACLAQLGGYRQAAELIQEAEVVGLRIVGEAAKLYDGLGPSGFRESLLATIRENSASE